MATSKDYVYTQLSKMMSGQAQILVQDGSTPNALALFRDGKVQAYGHVAWANDNQKEALLGAVRQLAIGLLADAAALSLDVYLARGGVDEGILDVMPSENPKAREAICGYGFLAGAEKLAQSAIVYGRDDNGNIYFDTEASFEIADEFNPLTVSVGGLIVDTFRNALKVHFVAEQIDWATVLTAIDAIDQLGSKVTLGPEVVQP